MHHRVNTAMDNIAMDNIAMDDMAMDTIAMDTIAMETIPMDTILMDKVSELIRYCPEFDVQRLSGGGAIIFAAVTLMTAEGDFKTPHLVLAPAACWLGSSTVFYYNKAPSSDGLIRKLFICVVTAAVVTAVVIFYRGVTFLSDNTMGQFIVHFTWVTFVFATIESHLSKKASQQDIEMGLPRYEPTNEQDRLALLPEPPVSEDVNTLESASETEPADGDLSLQPRASLSSEETDTQEPFNEMQPTSEDSCGFEQHADSVGLADTSSSSSLQFTATTPGMSPSISAPAFEKRSKMAGSAMPQQLRYELTLPAPARVKKPSSDVALEHTFENTNVENPVENLEAL